MPVRWSVSVVAEGDRVMSARRSSSSRTRWPAAVAWPAGSGATGTARRSWSFADDRDEAIEKGRAAFAEAVAKAGLPDFPIVHVEAVSEDEDTEEL